jgi:hypothetical protein
MGALFAKRESKTALEVPTLILSIEDEEFTDAIVPKGMVEQTRRILATRQSKSPGWFDAHRPLYMKARMKVMLSCCIREGIPMRVAMRKRFMFDETMKALQEGAQQVCKRNRVLMGLTDVSGPDCRCRLRRSLSFIEQAVQQGQLRGG